MLTHIENNLKIKGAVLIFLPGWAWISELNNYLQQNETIGKQLFSFSLTINISESKNNLNESCVYYIFMYDVNNV